MSNTLTDSEKKELSILGKRIVLGLSCNENGDGFPCRTDRIHSINDMVRYLEIHDLKVIEADD